MSDQPTQDLATRAFQKRVLDEFAATRREVAGIRGEVAEIRREVAEIRAEQALMRTEITEIRTEIVEVRTQQVAMAKNIGGLDPRLTSLEQGVDERLKETRPIWEGVQEQLQKLGEKFDGVLIEFYELRNELRIHGRRIGHLEERVSG
jgi:chromosome segregation ATPase